ncbi:TRAP transporter permease [Desulfoferula mesophila]|uniref:C4-dicarboxylate ABC transporter permease n=1 Tax=Desulfoferula mesophila TaxID=3058419 RepID=A0AAU9EHZ9_9BACT|nr:C4-dicarboxylate ABC transporter permease [Desulfoferula mesophilus]
MPSSTQVNSVADKHGPNQALVHTMAKVVMVLAVALSLYQLYTAGITALTALVQRSVHLGAILSLTYLLQPPFDGARKDRFSIWLLLDWLLVLASCYCVYYICANLDEIFARQGDWLDMDLYVSIAGTILVLEACRRVIGGVMAGICFAALVYAYTTGDIIMAVLACLVVARLCNKPKSWLTLLVIAATAAYWLYAHYYEPYLLDMFLHKPYSIERISTTLWLTTEGVFGLPLGVAATFVFVFVLFGAFLEVTGGGNFFIDLAYALTGRFSGGPAKTAVLASGFMGSVSGSAVGNVVATGSFTIPMMKRVGYRPHVAGAIEAAASTGGQLMPPIMGAGAFLMAEFTNTSYLTIIKVALVPAIMYYLTVLLFVHFEAKKEGIVGQPKEKLPKAWKVVKGGLHFIIPVGILVYVLMANYSPMMAGFVAVMSTLAASILANLVRWSVSKGMVPAISDQRLSAGELAKAEGKMVLTGLERGAKNAIMVSVACAAAGIIVGTVTLTGMGLKFSSLVLDLSFGIEALAILLIGAASLVLGMGLPVTASYIVLATLAGPALLDLGVPLLVTHMIVFWYSQDANVTPPVSLASFAGAGVAGANPMQTAFTSWKLAKGLYIIPIVMAYRPLLGMGKDYELMHWEVILAWITTLLGLVAFAAALDRYMFRKATVLETIMLVFAAALLFWPDIMLPGGAVIPAWLVDSVGLVLLALVVAMQKFISPAAGGPQVQTAGN